MAEVQLHFILRAEPIVHPSFSTLALASDPAPDQVSIVRVPAFKAAVDVEESMLHDRRPARQVCVNSLDAQVELGNFGDVREVEPGRDRGFVPREPWIRLVFRKGVAIESKPVAQLGNSVGEVKSPATIAWVIRSSG